MKKNIKDRLLKVLHVVSYILSVLFILGCIIFGVGSCNLNKTTSSNIESQKGNEVVNPIRKSLNYQGMDYQYVLMPYISKTQFDNQYKTINNIVYSYVDFGTNESATSIVPYDTGSYTINVYLYNCHIYINSDEYTGNYYLRFFLSFNDSLSAYLLGTIDLYEVVNTQEIFTSRLYHYINGLTNPLTILCNELQFNNVGINPLPNHTFNYRDFVSNFFIVYDSQDIEYSFNNYNVNPIQFLSYDIMSNNVAHNIGTWTATIDLDLHFLSNGQSFKKIRFRYDYVWGAYYDNNLTEYSNMSYIALSYIAYQRTYDDEWINVCYPRIFDYVTHTDSNNVAQVVPYPFTDFSTYLWANEGYKDILIVDGAYNVYTQSSSSPIANLTNIQVLTYQGEMNKIGVDVSNTNNVFILLGQGFTSVAGLFGIILLPGITIGTLLFLPLVVAIVLAIIKLLRK